MTAISLKAHRFMEANRRHPAVYCSVEDHLCTYRLSDGSTWTFNRREAATIGHPLWAYLKVPDRRVISNRQEEIALLEKLEREALLPSPLA
jgi:hypothetical protein